MRRPSLFSVLTVLAVLFGIGLALANAVLGPLNHDEGWYLLASRFTAHGYEPYTGYSYSQGPFLPYFYALFQRLWFHPGSALGVVLPARLFTAVLGLGACGLASALAYLLVRLQAPATSETPATSATTPAAKAAAFATWILTACSPVHSYFSTIPKTYALTALLLGGGFLSLAFLFLLRSRQTTSATSETSATPATSATSATTRTPLAFNSGVFLGLAVATRLSFALVLPAVCLALWLAAPRGSRRQGFRDALFLGLGALFVLSLSVGRALYLHPDTTLACIAMHAAREGGGLLSWLTLRAGFLSRTFQAYPLFWALFVLAIALLSTKRLRFPRHSLFIALGSSVLLVSLLHALAPMPYDDYQTPLMPFAAAVLVAALFTPPRDPASKLCNPATLQQNSATLQPCNSATSQPQPSTFNLQLSTLFLLSLVFALSSPLLMDWVTIRKDRFWFEQKPRPDVLVLRDAGRDLRALHAEVGGMGNLFTQDAYLAVESGLPVSPRLAMGPFSFYPDLSPEETKTRRLLNEHDVIRMLDSDFPPFVAATSGYTFAISCPTTERTPEDVRQRLLNEIALRYEPVKTIPNFGQAHTPLTLWRRKTIFDAKQ